MPSKSPPVKSQSVLSRREEEMKLGAARFKDRVKLMDDEGSVQRVKEAAKRQEEEDNERLEAFNKEESAADKAKRDRAGAEVIDQAQTELEATQHLADRENTIVDREHENEVERLQGDADPKKAQEVTTDVVTAQAVNQPTILANNAGQDTENKPLNTSGMTDDALAMHRQPLPEDKHVPKTRTAAERVAKGKVPQPKQVVGEGKVVNDPEPQTVQAVKVVDSKPDDILGE